MFLSLFLKLLQSHLKKLFDAHAGKFGSAKLAEDLFKHVFILSILASHLTQKRL